MALGPGLRCTPQGVAAPSRYENADPFLITGSSGTLDMTSAQYAAIDDRSVRVTGSAFTPAPVYTVKLEGAERVGYQSITIGSIRDPYMIRQIDDWTARLHERVRDRVMNVLGGEWTRMINASTSASKASTGPWAGLSR